MKAYRYCGASCIQIIQGESHRATVEEFWVDPPDRHKGVGKRLMDATCRDADRENVTLYLKPIPFGAYDIENETNYPPEMTYKELCTYYRSFGFRFKAHSEFMMRKPKEG